MIKKYSEVISGLVLLAITAVYYSQSFIKLKFALSAYGGDFMPKIYSYVMFAVCAALIIKGLLGLKDREVTPITKEEKIGVLKVCLSALAIVAYLWLMSRLGFILATSLYLVLQMCIITKREKIKIVNFIIYSILVAILLDYIFVKFFYLGLPTGLIGF